MHTAIFFNEEILHSYLQTLMVGSLEFCLAQNKTTKIVIYADYKAQNMSTHNLQKLPSIST